MMRLLCKLRIYFRYNLERFTGILKDEVVEKINLLMQEINFKPEDRKVVVAARKLLKRHELMKNL